MTNNATSHMCKRSLLIICPAPALVLIHINSLNWCRTMYYVIPATMISTFIILLNFPNIVKLAHSRPIYYDDLDTANVVQAKYQQIFVISLQITITLIMSGMCYYYYNRFHNSTLTNMELLGVLGGYLSILMKVERVIGKILLTSLNHHMRSKAIEIELAEFSIPV